MGLSDQREVGDDGRLHTYGMRGRGRRELSPTELGNNLYACGSRQENYEIRGYGPFPSAGLVHGMYDGGARLAGRTGTHNRRAVIPLEIAGKACLLGC